MTKSGNRWTARQQRDPFVHAARRAGFRARAVFKLEEIDRKYRLINADSLIVDLGAAPGSWSQYAASRVASDRGGRVIAVDLLEMKSVDKVTVIRGDFTSPETHAAITAALTAQNKSAPDLVLSDLSPNLSGVPATDQARMATLQQAVLEFCRAQLRDGGALLTKLFAGESEADIRAHFGECFAQTQVIKPAASRSQSREIYLLARGWSVASAA